MFYVDDADSFICCIIRTIRPSSSVILPAASLYGCILHLFFYLYQCRPTSHLTMWELRGNQSDVSEDLNVPASRGYVERIFSLCEMLTTGHRSCVWNSSCCMFSWSSAKNWLKVQVEVFYGKTETRNQLWNETVCRSRNICESEEKLNKNWRND